MENVIKMYYNHNSNFSTKFALECEQMWFDRVGGVHDFRISNDFVLNFVFIHFLLFATLHILFSSFVCEKVSIRMHEAKKKYEKIATTDEIST